MSNESKRKIAIVTGGSRGLGKEMALSLGRSGVEVVLTYNTQQDEAETVVGEIQSFGVRAAALQLDVGNIRGLDDFMSGLASSLKTKFESDRIDFLVNNAGIGKAIPIAELTEEDFDLFMNVHFKGVVFLTQKALQIMNDNGGVVFITAAGDRYNVHNYAVYASCKGAVEVFSRYVAKEYGPKGIRANTVAPGGIVTDFNNGVIRNNPKAQEFIKGATAMGRLGYADDIGGIVAFLCSDDARWMTGQRLEVTGGFNL
jgi:NAD(P)-dependent dehydrogenase (short-subunit alcohol dehydrogenase family)